MAANPAQVLRQMQGGWLECRDAQGVFYYNQTTQQSTEMMPAEAAMPAYGMPQPQQQAAMYSAPPPQPQAAAPQAAQGPQAVVKSQIGVWQIAEDAQGEFYFNSQTGQAYNEPPPELIALVQQQRQQQQMRQAAAQAPAPQAQYAQYQQYQAQQQPSYQPVAAAAPQYAQQYAGVQHAAAQYVQQPAVGQHAAVQYAQQPGMGQHAAAQYQQQRQQYQQQQTADMFHPSMYLQM